MSKTRIDVTNVPFHVFARGNNKGPIFLDEKDRLVFLKYWREAKAQFDYRMFAYALMDNHFHILIQMEKESSLAKLMHDILFEYARYINRKYGRVGHLFQGRYNSIPVESDSYFQIVERYIHLNAVKAGMVERPEDFKWSSYRERFHSMQEWIDHETALSYFGHSRDVQLDAYRRFTEEGIKLPEEWTFDQLRKITCFGSAQFFRKVTERQNNKPSSLIHLPGSKESI